MASPASRSVRIGLIAATVGALAVGAVALPGIASASGTTVPLAGSRPDFTAHARDLGRTAGSSAVDFKLVLKLRDPAGAEAFAQAVSTPGSAQFRHYLTTAQFRDRYAATAATVAAVSKWARSAGLHVASVASSREYVDVTGTTAQAEKLVGTTLHNYAYQGKSLAAPTGDYVVPSSIAARISGIMDLDGSSGLYHPADTLPPPAPGVRYGVQPCSAYYGEKIATDKPSVDGKKWPYTICGYYGPQYESAFGLTPLIKAGNDGHGVTVAITDAYASPTIGYDASHWSKLHGLPDFAAGQFTQSHPATYTRTADCAPQGWYGEETLDVEAVHSTAPGANILYVGAKNCGAGLNNAWADTIDQHKADIVTNSWGVGIERVGATQQAFFHQYLMQAAMTGVTVTFSSGDSGDEVAATGYKHVDFPVNDPYATGVGGTSTEIGKSGQIVFQHGWENAYAPLSADGKSWVLPPAYASGGGGGTSKVWPQPAYQKGVVPTSISEYFGSTPMRAVPDVAMPGDSNTGLRIGQTQTFSNGTYYAEYRLGGTSLSSPLFAGVAALAVQKNGPLGFINPLLYKNIGTSALTDVLPPASATYTVRTDYANFKNPEKGLAFRLQDIDVPTTIKTRTGYDDVTGVGTPNGAAFVAAMHN